MGFNETLICCCIQLALATRNDWDRAPLHQVYAIINIGNIFDLKFDTFWRTLQQRQIKLS